MNPPARHLVAGAIVLALASSGLALAQTLPNLATVKATYDRLKATVKPDGQLEREIDAIDRALAVAIRLGRAGEARRLLAKGTSLLNGQPWTEVADFAGSLVLRSDRMFADPVRPFTLRVEQIYPSTLELRSPLSIRLTLRRLARSPQPGTGRAQVGDVVRDLGSFENVPRDLRESPFLADLDFAGIADGRYVVVTEVSSEGQALAARGLSIEIHKNLDGRLLKLEAARKTGGDLAQALRADILYPGDYIRRANRGAIDSGDFDVERELADAEATLASLKARRDPFAGRTGDFKRHYLMAESGEIMPYHLYVPTSYTGRKPFPVVVALHGHGADEDSFFAGGPRQVPAMAEERGFLVVAPLGYRVDAGYGRTTPMSPQDPELKRKRELSEADVLNVIEIVRKAYRVDEDRIYLFGHSMGAAGTWYLGAKYPERWAALACFAGPGVPATVERMRQIAQFVVHGDADTVVSVAESRAMVAEMQRLGIDHRYIEVPGGDHYNVLEPNVAEAFGFFDKHKRLKRAPEKQKTTASHAPAADSRQPACDRFATSGTLSPWTWIPPSATLRRRSSATASSKPVIPASRRRSLRTH